MSNILDNIREIRLKKGYSQEYIAGKLKMKQAGYGLIETGKRQLTYNDLLQIAIAFEMDIIDLIKYPDTYILDTKDICAYCKRKDRMIEQLSDYIDIIQGGQKKTKIYKVANS